MRRSIRVMRRLDATPEDVFAVLSDHARYDRFDGVARSELVRTGDADPNGLGAIRWIWLGPLRFEEEVTAYEPPVRLDYVIRNVRGLPITHEGGSIRLKETESGTDAIWTSTFEIPIPVLGPAIDAIFARQLAQGFGGTLEKSAQLAPAA